MRNDVVREMVGVPGGIALILAIWEVLSPWIHGYQSSGVLVVNEVVSGLIVGVLAIIGLVDILGWGTRAWLGWAMAIMGLWLFFSPLLLYGFQAATSQLAMANDMIVGMGVLAMGLVSGLAAWSSARAS